MCEEVNTAKVLLRAGAHLNALNTHGFTPVSCGTGVFTASLLISVTNSGGTSQGRRSHATCSILRRRRDRRKARARREAATVRLASFANANSQETCHTIARDKSECGEARYLHCGIACVRTSGGSLAREDERVISLKQQNVGRQAIGFCEKTSAELFPLFNTLYEGLA